MLNTSPRDLFKVMLLSFDAEVKPPNLRPQSWSSVSLAIQRQYMKDPSSKVIFRIWYKIPVNANIRLKSRNPHRSNLIVDQIKPKSGFLVQFKNWVRTIFGFSNFEWKLGYEFIQIWFWYINSILSIIFVFCVKIMSS